MITKFIEPWILFPGNLIILLAVVAVVLFRTRRHMLRWGQPPAATGAVTASASLIIGVTLLLYVASIGIVADRVMGALEHAIPPASPEALMEADAVVVLGGGVVYQSPAELMIRALDQNELAERTTGRFTTHRTGAALSPEAESRLLHGVRLARRLRVPLVVSGGRVLSAEVVPPEAEVAAVLALDLGIPQNMIRVEPDSRTTAENARFTAERFRFQRVVVVTSAYHMRRALLAFEREGLSPIAAPAAYHRDQRPLRPVMFMPNVTDLRDTATVLRERVGFVWYRLTV
ncbi:MAG: YdcF family protein [Alkalispirochaeta sp.]